MAVKRTGQPSFVEAFLATKGGSGQLDRLHDLVKWYRFEKLIGHLRVQLGLAHTLCLVALLEPLAQVEDGLARLVVVEDAGVRRRGEQGGGQAQGGQRTQQRGFHGGPPQR